MVCPAHSAEQLEPNLLHCSVAPGMQAGCITSFPGSALVALHNYGIPASASSLIPRPSPKKDKGCTFGVWERDYTASDGKLGGAGKNVA